MPKISVIVPVYKAAGTLRICVESIISGEEKDVEVILVEDCSGDESWQMCQILAAEYPQVICLQNDRNRGVSHTRNRGLDAAGGQYVMFVDSDDWVAPDYVKTMLAAAEQNPEALAVCGYTQIDQRNDTRRDYVITNAGTLERSEFYRLSGGVMLQQLWNKIFPRAGLEKHRIRFNEQICMGEDYEFVLDWIERAGIQAAVIVPRPLYFYVRTGTGSLMDNWFKYENYEDALARYMRVERLSGPSADRLEQFKQGYCYRIMWETTLPRKEKLKQIYGILGRKNGFRFYCRQKLIKWLSKQK